MFDIGDDDGDGDDDGQLTRNRQLIEFLPKIAMGSTFMFNDNSYSWGAMSSWPGSGMQSGVASVALLSALTDNTCNGATR